MKSEQELIEMAKEAEEIQRNINFAREDATLLANRVVEKVWGRK